MILQPILPIFLLILCFASPISAATGRIECNSFPSKILTHPVNYCVILPPSYDADKSRKYPVLYFFHGLGDNEQMFIHAGGFNLVQDLWERSQLGEFLIATPNAGNSFYINSHDGTVRYEDFLVREFLPGIEARYRTRPGRASAGGSSPRSISSQAIASETKSRPEPPYSSGVTIPSSPSSAIPSITPRSR